MTTVTRQSLLSALRYLMQAAGITPAELARHGAEHDRITESVMALPLAGEVDIDAANRRQPTAPALVANSTPPRAPLTRRRLTPQAERVIELADRPDGVSVHEMRVDLSINEPTAHRHCQRLADELHLLLTRVKLPGERAHRYFARPAAALDYLERNKPAPVPAPAPAPRAELSEAEQKSIRVALAKKAGAKKGPPPLGARTERRQPEGQPVVTISDQAMRPSRGEAVETASTKRTIDNTKRPNSRVEAAPPLPPDPRWPSFASAPLGVNPDTGRPWA